MEQEGKTPSCRLCQRYRIPLIPAFASTVHDSQGRTLRSALFNIASIAGAKGVQCAMYAAGKSLKVEQPFPVALCARFIVSAGQRRTQCVAMGMVNGRGKSWNLRKLMLLASGNLYTLLQIRLAKDLVFSRV